MAKNDEAERQRAAERELAEREGEAEEVEAEQQEAAKQEQRRERERERAASVKAQAEAAAPPSQRSTKSGTAYSRERLISESRSFLGVPSYVAAGALFDSDEYVTVDDARAAVERFQKRD